jgi:hypothetical protein
MPASNSNNKTDNLQNYDNPKHKERMAQWRKEQHDPDRGTTWGFMIDNPPVQSSGSSVAATAGSHKDELLKRSENIAQGIFEGKASHPPPDTAKKDDHQENKSTAAPVTDKAQSKPQSDSEKPPTPTTWKSSNPA